MALMCLLNILHVHILPFQKNFNSEILHVDSDFWYFLKKLKALTTLGQSLL